jgi:hypothetical protein
MKKIMGHAGYHRRVAINIPGPAVLPGRKDRGDETSPQQELVDAWNL